MRRTKQLKDMLNSPQVEFLMEAHSGLSARIVDEAGFAGIWASGLSISASLGLRDNNEASWTQVLEVVEYMSDASSIPILLDADTGYGNFNNVRRLVRKLEQRQISGMCIEDKLFPKSNSFREGRRQPMAPTAEFAGKIRAAKDTQLDPDFCVVARVEALIAGYGLEEALMRAHAYADAGADAVLIHSKLGTPFQILSFMDQWDGVCPVVIVPTKYYTTRVSEFEQAGVSVVIWANHLMRSSITAMQAVARRIKTERSLVNVEPRVATLAEVFRLQNEEELQQAEAKYLPESVDEEASTDDAPLPIRSRTGSDNVIRPAV
jgi:phosphoenolpyruvate phosphomutase